MRRWNNETNNIKYILLHAILLAATGYRNITNDTTTKVENAFSNLYEIERLDVISEMARTIKTL